MRPRTIVVLDDSVPCSVPNGAHASLSAREWQPFNATKSQGQPGVSPALGWQSLCFPINLDAMSLLQTFLLFFLPPSPIFSSYHILSTCSVPGTGPGPEDTAGTTTCVPRYAQVHLGQDFLPGMPASLLPVNPSPPFFHNVAQKQASLWTFSLPASPTNSGHSTPQHGSVTFRYRRHSFHLDTD